MSSRDNKKFRDLQRTWYKKLAKTGFVDAENTDKRKEDMLLQNTQRRLQRYGTERRLALQRYYELAGHFYWDFKFDTSREKRVWEMHSQGLTGYEIAQKLGMSKSVVYRMVKSLAATMLAQRVGEKDD